MSKTEETDGVEQQPSSPLEPTPAVFTSKMVSPIHTFFAMVMWLGSVHLIVLLNLVSFLLLPLHKYFLVLGMFVVLMFIPIDENSRWGLALARYIYKYARGYFPATLYVEDMNAFNPDQSYVFGYEPHSVWPIGTGILSDLTGFMPTGKVKILASSAVRFIILQLPEVPNLSPIIVKSLQISGVLHAIPEAYVDMDGTNISNKAELFISFKIRVAFLKARKGFIRLAMENNSPVVPVFAFGQSYVYNWWKPRGKFFLKLARAIKFTPIVFWGTLWSPIPLRRPVLVVVGKPIQFKKNSTPTMEEVQEVHGQFVEALQNLFDRHKARAGYPDLELRMM
ncbi:diacylglycerol O-acyltransferase 2D-like protein [Tanacetum coccineum]